MSGEAAPREPRFARMVVDRILARSSGILQASRGRLRRAFCFERGQVVFAASNVIEEQVLEVLARGGLLGSAPKDAIAGEAARLGTAPSRLVVDSGLAAEDDVRRAVEGLVERLFFSTLEWPDGAFEFAAGRANLEREVTVRLNPALLLIRHARGFPDRLDLVRVRIGPPDARPRVIPERMEWIAGTDLDAAATFLLARCDGTLEVAPLVAASPAGPEETIRTLAGLVSAGIVVASRSVVAPKDGSAPPLDREECLAILQRADGADCYGVLSLPRQASEEDVRASYYALARRYHPDRFRSGPLQDLLPRMESYFADVTEAYNTLSHPTTRAEYDALSAAPTPQPDSVRQTETTYLAKQNYARGKALVERRRYAEAATFLENAARLDGNQAAYALDLGLVLARNARRRADAERSLLRAAELEPTDTRPYVALGQLYERAGKLAHAARMYREALRWDAEHAEASALLAGVAAAEGSEAVPLLEPIFGG